MKHAHLLVFLLIAFLAESALAVCEDIPKYNRFEGVEYKSNYISKICESAHPRLNDKNSQYNWEAAIYKRCQSLYHRSSNGPSKPTYKEACLAAENKLEKNSSMWSSKIIRRVKEPVCGLSFTTGKNNEKEYACIVWYSSDQERRAPQALRSDAVLKP